MGADGFEPSKSLTTDLQSAPFGHLGTLPYTYLNPVFFFQYPSSGINLLLLDRDLKHYQIIPYIPYLRQESFS